jgi:3-oxoacyl-[acyl-carrier protein] reductase
MRTLQHQNALIICAGAGWGPAIAERYAALGANIILHHVADEHSMQHLISNIKAMGVKAMAFSAGINGHEQLNKLFTEVKAHFKKIDIIVINHDNPGLPITEILYNAVKHINAKGRLIYIATSPVDINLRQMLECIESLALKNAARDITINTIVAQTAGNAIFDRNTVDSDIADVAEFFASDLGGAVTGQHLIVNGINNILTTFNSTKSA